MIHSNPDLGGLVRLALAPPVRSRAIKVGLIVGTILTLINHGDQLFSGGPIIWWKLVLTYCVPYMVSTYSAVSFAVEQTAAE